MNDKKQYVIKPSESVEKIWHKNDYFLKNCFLLIFEERKKACLQSCHVIVLSGNKTNFFYLRKL